MKKLIVLAIVLLISLKILLMPLGSHPFDFAAFVYQARTYFDYGINPLFYLNKGLPIIFLFYLPYSLYSVLIYLLHSGENILLLHFIFKLPLLMLDLGAGFLLWKIMKSYSESKFIKYFGILLWIANPLVFWSTEFQGQYAILAVFFSVLSFYLLLVKRKSFLSIVVLACTASIYYYSIIFLPFYILWIAKDDLRIRNILRTGVKSFGGFTLTFLILYLPFILMPSYLEGLISSLMYHSAPDAPQFAPEIVVPVYSLFRLPYYLFTGQWPSNINSPAYFRVIALATFAGLAIIVFYCLFRIVQVLKNKNYSDSNLIRDCVVVLTLFIVLIGKLQTHYILWLLPLMLIAAVVIRRAQLLIIYGLLSLLPILIILGTTNLAVFLTDILPWNSVSLFLGYSKYTLSLGGFVIIVLLISTILFMSSQIKFTNQKSMLMALSALWAMFLILFIFISIKAYHSISVIGVRDRLASENLVYNYAYTSKEKSVETLSSEQEHIDIPYSDFENLNLNSNTYSGYLDQDKYPWYLYNYGDREAIIASITTEDKMSGEASLKIEAKDLNARGEVSHASSDYLIPILPQRLYRIQGFLKSAALKGVIGEMRVRFSYEDKAVISGSDIVIANLEASKDWEQYKKDIVPPNAAAYAQILISIKQKDDQQQEISGVLYADKLEIFGKKDNSRVIYSNMQPRGNKEAIFTNIIKNPLASEKFELKVNVNNVPLHAEVTSASLNDCLEQFNDEEIVEEDKNRDFVASFPSSCIDFESNKLSIDSVNLEDPEVRVVLAHKPGDYEVTGIRRYILLLLAGISVIIAAWFIYKLTIGYTRVLKNIQGK